MGNAASRNVNIFEQYENLKKSGMAPLMAQAVKDFVLATLQEMVSMADWREYKAERTNDLEKLAVHQDHKWDQVHHAIKENHQKLEGEIAQVHQELKSDIAQVHQELKGDISQLRQESKNDFQQAFNKLENKINDLQLVMIRWIIGLFFAQTGLNVAIITGIKIFGH